ncbi:MAG: hypothetical protein A4E65_03169 [Syntrophorhabdus sp. PtaU1.Bin153]|nr:MAG: hypothetical protein A4E65_03169 [Syntrophorhabdus sp. PtaU1.Bin153]
MNRRQKIKPVFNYGFICTVSIVSLLILLTHVPMAHSQYPEDPIPVLDFGKSQKAIAVSLHFTGSTSATLNSVKVFYGRAHGRAGAPPLLGVHLLGLKGNVIESFNAWNPLWTFVGKADGSDSLVVRTEANGSIIFPFSPNVATVSITNKELADSPVISVDLIPYLHDFCKNNQSDTDCEHVVNRFPVCNAGGPYLAECAGSTTSIALNGTGSSDPDGDQLTYGWSGSFTGGTATGPNPTVQFPGTGSFTVNLGVNDDFGGTASCRPTVNVVDTSPPAIDGVRANPNILWPPLHQMIPVTVTIMSSDICGPAPLCRIAAVSSSEPVNGLGDGDMVPDWEITADRTLNLRAERSGKGTGRVYTITVACTDTSGNTTSGTTKVSVPLDVSRQR